MSIRLSTGFATLGCVLLASCYPVNENPQDKTATKTPEKTATTQDPQKLKEQEAAKNKEKDKEKEKEDLAQEKPAEKPEKTATEKTTEKTKTPAEPKRDYTFANKVPGKDGFVLSPYNGKVVDVRDIPSGTLVQDPTYPAAEKKFFRVP